MREEESEKNPMNYSVINLKQGYNHLVISAETAWRCKQGWQRKS